MKKTVLLLLITSLFACQPKSNKESTQATLSPEVCVYYLHQPKGCASCKAMGSISKTTTEKYFKNEMDDGKLAYFDLDISKTENDTIAKKFDCSWAGLYVLYRKQGKEHADDLTGEGFMYAVSKPDTLEQIIKTSINKKLQNL
jgi:hypothetical protein